MGFHTTVSAALLILTASVWMAAGLTHTCPVLPGSPGRDGRDGSPGPPGAPCISLQPKGLSYNYPADGCDEIVRNNPQSSNGRYWVRDSSDNSTKRVYCYPREHTSCGEGVWMRIGYFEMGGNLAECPEPLERFAVNGRWYCRRTGAGCTSVHFSALGKDYTAVCGMVEGYQYGSMDAFETSSTSINSVYLDGISITHGSPRQHIWSYVVGDVANPTSSRSDSCPCTAQGTTSTVPSVIGSDYYCSSGNAGSSDSPAVVHTNPLWRTYGPSCVSGSTCCNNLDQPWFKKKLARHANDDLEMRWCADQSPSEATATTRVELYIRVD